MPRDSSALLEHLRFVSDDSGGLYLVADIPEAASWVVTVRSPGEAERATTRMATGTWLNAYHVVRESEVIWDVGWSIIGPRDEAVVVRAAREGLPLVIRHPRQARSGERLADPDAPAT